MSNIALNVAKFGGTSVADHEAMLRCAHIIKSQPETRVVVVSASAGVTNYLVTLSQKLLTREERTEIIEKFSLNHLKNFHFVDGQSDQSRYIIDSTWYGELPRSYFVQSNGKFHGKSGLVKESTLIKWLAP